jgi:hypothetical protein
MFYLKDWGIHPLSLAGTLENLKNTLSVAQSTLATSPAVFL